MQDELHAHSCIFQVHQQVPGLLHYPGLDRMLSGSEDPDAASAALNDGQDVDLRAIEQVGGEEIQRQDPLRLGPQELRPARAVPARSRADASVLEDLPDRGRRHNYAENRELTMDPPVSPRLEMLSSTFPGLCEAGDYVELSRGRRRRLV